MFGSILILFVLPWIDRSPVRSAKFRPIYQGFFWIFLLDCIVLGVVGANPPEGNWLILGRFATAWYFLHFVIVFFLSFLERPRPVPVSISEPVLKGGGSPAGAAAKPMEKA
jgi:quinol-cytochrome oxidoreductase complex cytochrome b subunit